MQAQANNWEIILVWSVCMNIFFELNLKIIKDSLKCWQLELVDIWETPMVHLINQSMISNKNESITTKYFHSPRSDQMLRKLRKKQECWKETFFFKWKNNRNSEHMLKTLWKMSGVQNGRFCKMGKMLVTLYIVSH